MLSTRMSLGRRLMILESRKTHARTASTANTGLKMLPGWRIGRTAAATGLADCSLVVATHRRRKECLALLDALLHLDDAPGEVVFVDGARDEQFSQDLWCWSSQHPLRFDLVYAASPTGLTLQRNAGIDISTREFVFFLDDDAIPLPGFFREIRCVFQRDAEERIGAVAGCIINEIDQPLDRRWQLRLWSGLIPPSEPMQYLPCGVHTPRGLMKRFSGTREVMVFFGGAVALRRRVFDGIRFSEYFQGYSFGEDTEMGLRVGSRWKIVCCGDAHMLHNPAPGGRVAGYARGRMEIVNRYFIWRRHIPHPGFFDKARFWADWSFQVGMDLAWTCVRPWQLRFAGHGAGLLAGMVQCCLAPPKYAEPAAGQVYALSAEGSRGVSPA